MKAKPSHTPAEMDAWIAGAKAEVVASRRKRKQYDKGFNRGLAHAAKVAREMAAEHHAAAVDEAVAGLVSGARFAARDALLALADRLDASTDEQAQPAPDVNPTDRAAWARANHDPSR